MYESSGGVQITAPWFVGNVTSKLSVLEPLERVRLACRVARKAQELWSDECYGLCSNTLALVEKWMDQGGGYGGLVELYSAISRMDEVTKSVPFGVPVWATGAVLWATWAAHSASLLMGDLEASAASSPSLRFMFDANARSSNLCVTRFTHDACSAVWLCGVVEPAAVSADMWVEIANDLKRAMGQKESASCCEEV